MLRRLINAHAHLAEASLSFPLHPLAPRQLGRDLAVEGDPDLVRRLPSFFPLPDKASDRIS